MTRAMLNARAKIQVMTWEALKRANLLTPDEVRTGDRLYVTAEYDQMDK